MTAESRQHDPSRLVEVYHSSAATLNLARAFVTGGYADLRQVHTWNTDFVKESSVGQRYERMAGEIERALTFMQAIGADPDEFHRVDFHTCHEGLVLDYEHAMTRIDSRTDLPYDVSAQSPPWRRNALPWATSANLAFSSSHSPAKTSGGMVRSRLTAASRAVWSW